MSNFLFKILLSQCLIALFTIGKNKRKKKKLACWRDNSLGTRRESSVISACSRERSGGIWRFAGTFRQTQRERERERGAAGCSGTSLRRRTRRCGSLELSALFLSFPLSPLHPFRLSVVRRSPPPVPGLFRSPLAAYPRTSQR